MNSYRSRLIVLTVAWLGLCGASICARAADAPGSGAAAGHDWPQWRGPHFDGSSNAANLPGTFSAAENVLWTAKLPGPGNGTPVVAGGRIFLSAIDSQSKKLSGLCLDPADGHLLWQKDMGIGFKENARNNMTSPSAVTDGKTVFFCFGSGDLAAFDREGTPLWSRNIQKDEGDFNFMWLYGSSPLLYDGKLYVQCLHNDRSYDHRGEASTPADSYLLAIDPQTGKDIWKHVRPNEAAAESKEAYTTPIPFESAAGPQIVLVGGDCVTGHDPGTGKELWRYGTWNPGKVSSWRMVTSAVCGEGMVFACAPKGGPVMAIKEGASGTIPFEGAAWQTKDYSSDVCIPLIYHHMLYILDGDKKTLYCVDPKTGQRKWQGQLQLAGSAGADSGGPPGPGGRKGRGGGPFFRASPTAADGKIFCINEDGDLWVVSADEFKVLNQVSLGGKPVRSSIALTDGRVLVRAGDQLFAFGKK